MDNRFEHIDQLIAKYLSGEATSEEVNVIDEWKNLNKNNKKEFELFEKIINQTDNVKSVIKVDSDLAWLKVKQKIKPEKGQIKHISKAIALPLKQLMRIAAILLIVAGLGTTAYYLLQPSQKDIIITAQQNIHKSILPDGSSIALNKNSSITYDENSFSNKRMVHLKGEAFFDVKHDEKNPFVIEAKGVLIEDIGTSFNVKSNPETNIVIITVVSGIVKLYTIDNTGITLQAGEEGTYNLDTKSFEKSLKIDKNIAAYKDKIFIFDNTDLEIVIKLLNDIYQSDIEFGNSNLQTCKLTATFNNEHIEDIVSIISETLGLTVQKKEQSIILQGEGCK